MPWSSFVLTSDLQRLIDAARADGSFENLDNVICTAFQHILTGTDLPKDTRLDELLEGMGDAFYALDQSWRFTYINRAAESYYGRPRHEMIGHVIWDIFPWTAGAELKSRYEEVLASGRRTSFHAHSVEFPERYVEFNIFPYARGIGVSFRDWTERRHAEEALRESQAQLSALADNLALGMVYQMSDDPDPKDRKFLYVSRNCERLLGINAEDARRDLSLIFDLLLPECLPYVAEREAESFRTGQPFDVELAVRHAATGETRWHRVVSNRRELSDGRFVWDGLQVDITKQKRAEEHLRLLINELNHRVKNTLAIVQSLASQSFRAVEDEPALQAKAAFEKRLFALARGHDILTRQNWESALLSEVVSQAIAPYRDQSGEAAFQIDGSDIRINPAMTLGLSMALHELCTNTVKYGALRCSEGRVHIVWAHCDGSRLAMTWKEEGGPPVARPTRKGFGMRLVERVITRELGGSFEIDYESSGLFCAINVPMLMHQPDDPSPAQGSVAWGRRIE